MNNIYTAELNSTSYRQLSKLSIARLTSHTSVATKVQMMHTSAYTAHQQILIERLYHQLKNQRSATR